MQLHFISFQIAFFLLKKIDFLINFKNLIFQYWE